MKVEELRTLEFDGTTFQGLILDDEKNVRFHALRIVRDGEGMTLPKMLLEAALEQCFAATPVPAAHQKGEGSGK